MKTLLLSILLCVLSATAITQAPAADIYDFIKKLITDSTGYENIGDWAIGNSKNFPVKWKTDHIVMSDDTSINFFRKGEANLTLHGKAIKQATGATVVWNLMLTGPRMGYSTFSILSSHSPAISPQYNLDSLFGKKPYKATLKKTCTTQNITGFNYYQLKLPKKDVVYLKLTWLTINQTTALRIDVYDNYSQYKAKLNCPN